MVTPCHGDTLHPPHKAHEGEVDVEPHDGHNDRVNPRTLTQVLCRDTAAVGGAVRCEQ